MALAGILIWKTEEYHAIMQNKIKQKEENISLTIEKIKELSHGKFSDFDENLVKSHEVFASLEDLKHGLIENKRGEKLRIEEDQKRNWISEGLAKFGAILRENSNDIDKLAYQVIKNLISYLDINQGGFFIVENIPKEGKILNLLARYAYQRKKFADKKVMWGEGLIGTCAIEQKSIFLTDIPEAYLEITSGLGKSNPNNLLIVPLVQNYETKGVLELASFRVLEPYEITFVENVAESIAMTIENILNTQRTSQLLKETQAQAEELSLQEEKMRQNVEELKLTQEKAARQAEKFISFTNSVNHTLIRADYDVNGILLYANTKFLMKLGYSGNREVEGKHISMFLNEKDRPWFDGIWESLAKGGAHFEGFMKHITKQGQDFWTMATYTCIRNEEGEVEKVLFLAIDTTEQKKLSLDYEGQIEALDRLNLKAEFSPDGKWLSSNALFNNTLKYRSTDLLNMNVYDFLDVRDIETMSEAWESVIRSKAFQGQIRMQTKYKEEKWFRATFTAVHDMYVEVSKVIFLATEITNEKIMEKESRKQNEQLKRQEEKFRLENLELGSKIKDLEKKTKGNLDDLNRSIVSLDLLLGMRNDLAIVVNNSGLLLYLNTAAAGFFKVSRSNIYNKSAQILLENNPWLEKNEFLLKLIEPGRSKEIKSQKISLTDRNGSEKNFNLNYSQFERDGEIIYLALLKDA